MASPPQLIRPDAAVGIDSKFTNSPEGWPTEAIRCGSIETLISFACYYTSRKLRPELIPKGVRAPIDPEYCASFFSSLPNFSTADAVGNHMVQLLQTAAAKKDTALIVQTCDGIRSWIDPCKDYLLLLRPEHRLHAMTAAFRALDSLADAGPARSPLEAEAAAQLQMQADAASVLIDALSALDGSQDASFISAKRIQCRLGFASGVHEDPPPPSDLASMAQLLQPVVGGIWSLEPSVIAEQWTLMDHKLFCSIPLYEFLECGWDKSRYEHAADTIRRFVDRFNATALWVSSEVLVQPSDEHRAAMITRFVQIASHLRRLNNFCGISVICMALRRESVGRLEGTWGAVHDNVKLKLQELGDVITDKEQYRRYKEAIKPCFTGCDTPAVPHLGAHTMEWTAAEMNLPDEAEIFKGGPKGINFKRYRTLITMTAPIVGLQQRSYLATGVIRAELPNVVLLLQTTLRNFHFHWDEDREKAVARLEARSHAIEPPPPTEEELQASSKNGRQHGSLLRSPSGKMSMRFFGSG